MSEAKVVSILADPHATMNPVKANESVSDVPYRETVDSLMFLAIVSRPDIAFAVNNAIRFLNKYELTHWRAVERIFA